MAIPFRRLLRGISSGRGDVRTHGRGAGCGGSDQAYAVVTEKNDLTTVRHGDSNFQ